MDPIDDICVVLALSRHRWAERRQRPTRHVRLPPFILQLDAYSCTHSAILSDVTGPATRGKALAHVGIAFAVCFCIGPPIGAYFASQPLPAGFSASGWELNVYAVPAIISLVLLVAETIFLAVALPETRGKCHLHNAASAEKTANGSTEKTPLAETAPERASKPSASERLTKLKTLRTTHFLFLAIFSGIEFTLTFLTFDCEQC